MKKIVTLLLCIMFVFTFFACSDSQKPNSEETVVETDEQESTDEKDSSEERGSIEDTTDSENASKEQESTDDSTEENNYIDPRDDGGWTPWH